MAGGQAVTAYSERDIGEAVSMLREYVSFRVWSWAARSIREGAVPDFVVYAAMRYPNGREAYLDGAYRERLRRALGALAGDSEAEPERFEPRTAQEWADAAREAALNQDWEAAGTMAQIALAIREVIE